MKFLPLALLVVACLTAPLLARTPVLQVHAKGDETVPARTGEVLYERLGRPDRYDFIADHYKMFYFMAGEAGWGRLIRWLGVVERSVAE